MFDVEVNEVVDACDLNCPLPILKARKALMAMQPGQVLKVIATDPTSQHDFPVFAEQTEHQLLEWQMTGGIFTYYLKVRGSNND